MSHIKVADGERYFKDQIIDVNGTPMVIYMILGNNLFLRHLKTLEWVGLQARKLMKKIGL